MPYSEENKQKLEQALAAIKEVLASYEDEAAGSPAKSIGDLKKKSQAMDEAELEDVE